MKLRSALLAATVMVAPVAAKAQAISGLYIGAGAGANFMQNERISRATFPALGVVQRGGSPGIGGSSAPLDTGFVGVASLGYGLGNGLRLEIEGNYRTNKYNHLSNGPLRASAGGNEQKYGGMFNVLYDIDPTLFGFLPIPLNPYVGIGAGAAYSQHQNQRFSGSAGNSSYLLRTNDGDVNFAYQAIVGAAVPISAVPGLSLTLEYRFFGVLDNLNYHYQYFSNQPVPQGTATRANLQFQDNYNHSVLVGLRYAFNAAPAAVPPPPAPAPRSAETARTYLVFFDWDRADLTDRARQIIAAAAQGAQQTQTTRIEVSGNTDTTGTARYNQGLSVRRAQNVAAELVRDGVPRSAITTQGFGFSRLLVPTGPGVREPQNRRVEIVLR